MSHDNEHHENHEHQEPPKPPARKKFRHRITGVHRHVTKYLYERDTIFATIWVFLFIFILGSIPINFYFLNPLKLALKDFDFNDMTYSKLKKTDANPIDNRIVVINIGTLDREGISMLVDKTATYGPKVMGLDVTFQEAKEPGTDSLIAATISNNKNLVATARVNYDKNKKSYFLSENIFLREANLYGYANFDNEDKETTRYFVPYQKDSANRFESFSVVLVKQYDPAAYEYLKKKNKKLEIINYSRRASQYLILDAEDVMLGNIDTNAIKGKIALLAYVNLDPNDINDKKFTPLNEKFAGKSHPDMNGILVHANIISMILDKNYIKKLPSWFNWLVAILVGWLHMSFFVRYYLEDHIWFHLVAKIAQLLSAIFFVYVGIYLFDRYRIKLDMKLTLVVIVMAVDVIYFYEAWAVWMHKKFGYKTVFHHKHH